MAIDPNDRIDPQANNLSDAQLEYVLKNHVKRYTYNSKDPVVKGAEKAVSGLGHRIQYLIEDLSSLNDAGFLDFDHRKEIWDEYNIKSELHHQGGLWEQLRDIERGDRLYHPPLAVRSINRYQLESIEIGVHLGHILRFFENNSTTEFEHPEIVCGFILGLSGRWLDDPRGIDQVGLWMKQLNGPLTEPLNNIEQARSSLLDAIDQKTEDIGLHDRIEERLVKTDFEPVLPLVAEVYSDIGPEIYDEIGGSQFIRPSTLDDLEVADLIWSSIADLKADDRLDRAEELTQKIIKDVGVLQEKSWIQDIPEIGVLAADWTADTIITSAATTPEELLLEEYSLPSNKNISQAVGKHLNDMTGDGTDPQPWDNYPLIRGTKGNRKGLTNYGRLLAHLITAREYVKYPLLEGTEAKNDLSIFFSQEEGVVYIPDERDILSGCYAFALGHVENHIDYGEMFNQAYEERLE